MIRKQLAPTPMPAWLRDIQETSSFNKEKVIEGSVYYPGAGLDSSVIHAYSGFAHSFIFSDYNLPKDYILKPIQKLQGYDVLLIKELRENEARIGTIQDLTPNRFDFYPELRHDEDINKRLQRIDDGISMRHNDQKNRNFCVWVVYQRRPRTNAGHGPERLSLLYVSGEGVATYQTLYNKNRLKPIAVVLKGVDAGGFGGNWTRFEKKNAIFERTVLANEAGCPKYIFADNRYDPEGGQHGSAELRYWSNYTAEISNRSFLGIWTHDKNTSNDNLMRSSRKMSKSFIDWYNERAIEIWNTFPNVHPYLPKVLGTDFDINASICYVGMNPSFNIREITSLMNRVEFEGFSPETLAQNSQNDINRRINLLKLLENIAVEDYSRYFQVIRDFHNSLDVGVNNLSFLDLFLVRQTDQSTVQSLLRENSNFRLHQLQFFVKALARINTKYICVLNAAASTHLCEHLNKGQIVSSYEHNGKTLFFAGMLSGGSMDRFSRERLRLSIRDVINSQPLR